MKMPSSATLNLLALSWRPIAACSHPINALTDWLEAMSGKDSAEQLNALNDSHPAGNPAPSTPDIHSGCSLGVGPTSKAGSETLITGKD